MVAVSNYRGRRIRRWQPSSATTLEERGTGEEGCYVRGTKACDRAEETTDMVSRSTARGRTTEEQCWRLDPQCEDNSTSLSRQWRGRRRRRRLWLGAHATGFSEVESTAWWRRKVVGCSCGVCIEVVEGSSNTVCYLACVGGKALTSG